jgi:predicted aldo/keto reductase-like oxidoreductase
MNRDIQTVEIKNVGFSVHTTDAKVQAIIQIDQWRNPTLTLYRRDKEKSHTLSLTMDTYGQPLLILGDGESPMQINLLTVISELERLGAQL